MNWTQFKKLVWEYANSLHLGQVRTFSDSEPSIQHCERVASSSIKYQSYDIAYAVGMLHDSLEDCPIGPEDLFDALVTMLLQAGMESSQEIAKTAYKIYEAVDALTTEHSDEYTNTKIRNSSYMTRFIKLCDIEDNVKCCNILTNPRPDYCKIYLEKKLYQIRSIGVLGGNSVMNDYALSIMETIQKKLDDGEQLLVETQISYDETDSDGFSKPTTLHLGKLTVSSAKKLSKLIYPTDNVLIIKDSSGVTRRLTCG